MAEVRYNNQGGTLGASLTSSGTTITFSSAPDFATLSGGDYIKLVLDYGTGNFEIVYLTAYTSGQMTGTITRAAEDSGNWPATAHSSGSGTWSCNPTVLDFPVLPGAGEPTSRTPSYVGQLYLDTTNSGFYVAFATSSGNWVQLGGYAPSYAWPGIQFVAGSQLLVSYDTEDAIVLAPNYFNLGLSNLTVAAASSTLWTWSVPVSTASVASISSQSISSGSAFQPNANADVELCFDITASGTLTLTMGPSSGTENTIINSRSVVAGTVITKRTPAGWKVVVTLSGGAAIGDATVQII